MTRRMGLRTVELHSGSLTDPALPKYGCEWPQTQDMVLRMATRPIGWLVVCPGGVAGAPLAGVGLQPASPAWWEAALWPRPRDGEARCGYSDLGGQRPLWKQADFSSHTTPWPTVAGSRRPVVLGAQVGAASPGAGPGEGTAQPTSSGWLPTRPHWDESCLQGQKHHLLSTWLWKHPALCPEHVFMSIDHREGAPP